MRKKTVLYLAGVLRDRQAAVDQARSDLYAQREALRVMAGQSRDLEDKLHEREKAAGEAEQDLHIEITRGLPGPVIPPAFRIGEPVRPSNTPT